MQVIEVIPLTRGSAIESLTYYSAVSYPVGTIIDVPIRKQTKRAVVTACKPVSATKTAVKTATFSLRKLPEQPSPASLPPAIIETALRLSKITPATLGSILFAILPPEVREGEIDLDSNLPCIGTYEAPAVTVLQGTYEERLRTYRSSIRETFAHRGSVLFLVPTSADVRRLEEALSAGIENRVVTFSPTHTKKKLAAAYATFADLSHAKLIITTPTYCCLDRHDITAVIIDQSQSNYYKSRTRPYLDARTTMTTLAKVTGRQVLMGDLLPRSEEEYLRREDIYNTDGDAPKRLTLPGTLTVITQSTEKRASDGWQLFAPETLAALQTTHEAKNRSFVLAARRGLAPLVTCVDCGYIFRCPHSGEPYSLHKTTKNGEEQRWFIAASSGRRLTAPDTCPDCGSWRLQERGIGIQHIEAELRKQLPQIPVVVFDHSTATTPRKAAQLLSAFYDQKGSLLLGTPMVLPYIEKPVATTVITSLEATRSVPTWRAEETFFALLLKLRELSQESVLLQSRTGSDELLSYAAQGLVEQFYTDELSLRSDLAYPPYSHFVHLTIQGDRETVATTEATIQAILDEYKLTFYTAPQFIKNGIRRYGLIRATRSAWPDEHLMNLLRSLPPSVRIEVNPERII